MRSDETLLIISVNNQDGNMMDCSEASSSLFYLFKCVPAFLDVSISQSDVSVSDADPCVGWLVVSLRQSNILNFSLWSLVFLQASLPVLPPSSPVLPRCSRIDEIGNRYRPLLQSG